jgi:hypothetical protein
MPSVPGTPTFQADRLVAADTWSFTDLTLRPSIQQALYLKDALDLFKDAADLHQIPTPSGRKVDFEKDLLPHLDGEVVVAVGGPVDHPQYSLLVHTNDVDGMLRLLADDPAAVFTRDARGALRSQARHGTDALAGYKNWVVYTNGASTLDAILDRLDGKGGPTLATEPRYRSVVDKLSGDRLGYGYLDVTPLVGQMPRNTPRFSESLTTHGRVAYSLGFEAGPESGVQVLGVQSVFMPDTPSVGTLPPSPDALVAMDRLPQNSMVAVAVSNIDTQSSFAALEKDQRDSGALDALLADAAGPYALAVTPPSDGADPSVNKFVGGLFFLTRVAPGVSAVDLDALDDAIGQG